MQAATPPSFYGPTVVRAAFVCAVFGWGIGFYGPPIFLHEVVTRTGWPLTLVSAAVTMHFLVGAALVACLPAIHARIGLAATTTGGAALLALGIAGWALAAQPWQLFAAAALSGGGWITMGAAAINAIVSPWYARVRPAALAKAYNGASIGGVIFTPLWVALIAQFGFTLATLAVGLATLTVVGLLSWRVLNKTPLQLGQQPDGDAPGSAASRAGVNAAGALPGRLLWRDRGFLTLAAAMALSMFAQIGLIAHLYVLLVPDLGTQAAGWAIALATGLAIAGRSVAAWRMGRDADRRLLACANYALQAAGTLALLAAGEGQTASILAGVLLFGAGIGNTTSLPPLVAQAEFAREDIPRVVALIVAMAQASYAFAPAVFALLLTLGGSAGRIGAGTGAFFCAVLLVQAGAITCMLAGRRGPG